VCVTAGVVCVLSQCRQLVSLDLTGCFHVSSTSLSAAIDVMVTSLDHPQLTMCLGGLCTCVYVSVCLSVCNNNNNNQDDIYSAVIMTEVIVRVHSVHLVNAEQRQAAADPQTEPHDLVCESVCKLLVYNHHRHLLLLLSPKADTHLPSHRG